MYIYVMDIYKFIDGSTPKPTNTIQLHTLTRDDFTVKAAIMSALSEHFIYLTSDGPTAQDIWKVVEGYQDWQNSLPLHRIVPSLFTNKMLDTDVLTDHSSSHEKNHTHSTQRCWSANDLSPYRYLADYLKSDETIACHLLVALPSSIDNIVDKL